MPNQQLAANEEATAGGRVVVTGKYVAHVYATSDSFPLADLKRISTRRESHAQCSNEYNSLCSISPQSSGNRPTAAHRDHGPRSRPAVTMSSSDQTDRSYFICKPYAVLSAFSDANSPSDQEQLDEPIAGGGAARMTLRDIFPSAPANIYPAGRLDYRSEGLLIATSNAHFKTALADPINRIPKRYWVLVDGCPDENALERLRDGMTLKEGDEVLPCSVARLDSEPELLSSLFTSPTAVNSRVTEDTRAKYCWLEFTLEQGLNRQIRRMCAAVGFPAIRIVRHSIGPFSLGELNLKEGLNRELQLSDFDRFWRFFYELKAKSRAKAAKQGFKPRSSATR